MDYEVELSARARRDAEEAYLYIARDWPSRANRWYLGLFDAVESLSRNPERCGLAAESEDLGIQLRQLLYGKRSGKYRILFELRGRIVFVHHIRHCARDWWRPREE
jgi:plasmid stabilization system protein ParE